MKTSTRKRPLVEQLDPRLLLSATRDPWVRPFTADSIWNTSIGDAAQYVPANLGLLGFLDGDNNYLYRENSADPLKRVIQPEGYPTPIYIRVPPTLSQATGPNNASAWLKDDGRTIKQISKFSVDPGQNPIGYATPDDDIISGNGRFGSHLGSGLSGLGGTLRTGELTGSGSIDHALGIEIDFAQMWRDNSNRANMAQTYRWPADRSDGNFGGTANATFSGVPNHTGTVVGLSQGALLALPPSFTEGGLGLSTVAGKKVFRALQDYGAYVVDSSNLNASYRPNGGFYANITIEPAAKTEFLGVNAYSFSTPSNSTINSSGAAAWLADMRAIYANLALVANNAADAIGGGGTTRRQPPPPAFGVPVPDAPSGLTVAGATPTSVALSWIDNATNETGYVLERATDRSFGTNLFTVGTLPANATTYTDSAPVGTTYFYRVHAVNDSGSSVDSPAARYNNSTTQSPLANAGAPSNGGTVSTTLATGNPGSTAGYQQSAVFAFQLPVVGAGANPFASATFTVTSPGQSNPFVFNSGNKYSLVGLSGVSDASTIAPSNYADAGTVLNPSFINPSTFGGNLGANQSVTLSQDVKNWLNTQYAGGANAGKYVFLRVTSSFANAVFSRVNFTGDSTNPALRPALRFTLANLAPTIASAASASPSPVTGTTTNLSVLAADDAGESALTYAWSVAGAPPAPVIFSNNGTNAAKTTQATFAAPGTYSFVVTATDAGGLSVSSGVDVTVVPTVTRLSASPINTSLNLGGQVQLTASAFDQFDAPITLPGPVTWALADGSPGTVDASGLYAAPASGIGGTASVTASLGTVASPSASVVVTNATPVLTSRASASPTPVTGTTALLSVSASDDGGQSPLIYNWTTDAFPVGAVPPTFATNSSNAASTSVVTFSAAGAYTFTVTISDASGRSVVDSIDVVVSPTLTSIALTPTSASVPTSATRSFSAVGRDQFGAALVAQPTFTWTVPVGAGTISGTGLYTAPPTAGNATVRASAGPKSADAAVTITAVTPVAPSGLTASVVSSSQINLAWTDNANNETSYVLERATNSAFTSGLTRVTLAANTKSYSATGLQHSTQYYFRVRAANSAGASGNSNTATAKSLLAVPGSPTNLAGTALSSTQVKLTWNDNSSVETGSNIERSIDGGKTFSVIATVGAGAKAYTVSGLLAGTKYSFRVRAFNSAGFSVNYTNVVTITTPTR